MTEIVSKSFGLGTDETAAAALEPYNSTRDSTLVFNAAMGLINATAVNGTLRLKPAIAVKWAAMSLGMARSEVTKTSYEEAQKRPGAGLAFIDATIADLRTAQESAVRKEVEIEDEVISGAAKQAQ